MQQGFNPALSVTNLMEYNVGVGLLDFLMTENVSPENGINYPAWNIQNIKQYPQYAVDQHIGAPAKIYVIKTNQHSAGKVFARTHLFSLTGEGILLVC